MFSPAKLAVFFTAALSVAAIPSHLARQGHHHREIAARVAQPEVAPVPEVVREISPSKRRMRRKRSKGQCKTSSSSSSSSPPPSPSPSPSPTLQGDLNSPEPTTSNPPQNPDATPDVVNNAYTPPSDPSPSPSPDPTPTSTTPAPSPTDNGGSNNGGNGGSNNGGQTYTGQGTFYATGQGACGVTNYDSDYIAAVSHLLFDSYPGYDGVNPNNNPICNKIATVHYQGKTIQVSLTDRCEGCAYGDLDFSPTAFNNLADPSLGRIDGISWTIG